MTITEKSSGEGAGRLGAALVYGLYLLSIPSAASFALVGVILAYVVRGDARGVARSHIESQIGLWWTAFWWAVAIAVITGIAFLFNITVIGLIIGIPLWIAASFAAFCVFIWFTVMSGWGLLKLINGESA